MDFGFDEDQLLFQTSVRDFLAKECTPEHVRAGWASETGRSPELWARLSALGVPGLLVPEAHGGMGLGEVDAVLVHEELGRAACAEPVVPTAAVAVPLLVELDRPGLSDLWLERIAAGEAIAGVLCAPSPFVADAHVARLLLLQHGDEVHALEPEQATLAGEDADDPSRRLFSVAWTPRAQTRVAEGARGRALWAAALDRGALAASAQALGVCERLIELAAHYAGQRRQFGRPIGSFQAVKHMLANCKVALEYARPVVQRAAWSAARGDPGRALHVSMAKLAACGAATATARAALQVHGALGYTWEHDLHIWMRRAWSLEQEFGRSAFHRARVEQAILSEGAELGPGTTFRGGL
jgi:alkylation response protein AidB-like acyl-CoA dehydrogenase